MSRRVVEVIVIAGFWFDREDRANHAVGPLLEWQTSNVDVPVKANERPIITLPDRADIDVPVFCVACAVSVLADSSADGMCFSGHDAVTENL